MIAAPEAWKRVVGHEQSYSVSSHGRVRSESRAVARGGHWLSVGGRMLTQAGRSAYCRVNISGRGVVRTHILVAEAFLGPRPPGHDICHSDGDCRNNHINNLRYDTRAGNVADMARHGTAQRGEAHYNATLTADQVRWVRALQPGGMTQREVARGLGVSRSAISLIIRRKTWAWLPEVAA